MTNEDYIMTQQHVVLLARIAAQLDIQGFLSRIDLAETVGPILDPTLFRDAMNGLGNIKALARAARPLVEEAKRQMEDSS